MLDRHASILEAVTAIGEPVSAADLARVTKLPRPTCYRLVSTLEDAGFLERTGHSGKFVLGDRLIRIAMLGMSDSHVQRAASDAVAGVVREIGETGFFARRRQDFIDLIHIDTPKDPKASFIYPGLGKRPVHACSSAKIIAAYASDQTRNALIDKNPEPFTGNTNIDRQAILDDLAQIRRQGFATCDGEIEDGIFSVAVPVQIGDTDACFSLGVVGPSKRVKSKPLDELVTVLEDAAIQASSAIQRGPQARRAPGGG